MIKILPYHFCGLLRECVMAPPKMSVTSLKPNLILMLRNVRNIIKTMKAIVFTPNFNAIIPGRGVTGVTEFCLLSL